MEVAMMLSTSMDGYISGSDTTVPSTSWTTKVDKKWFQEVSRRYKYLVVGRNTFATLNTDWFLKDRSLIVLDRNGDNEGLADLRWSSSPRVYRTNYAPDQLVKALQDKLPKLLVCGGAKTYQRFLELNLVDLVYQSICPIYLGGGVRFLDGFPERNLAVKERRFLDNQTTGFVYLVSKLNRDGRLQAGDKLYRVDPNCHACKQDGIISGIDNTGETVTYLFSFDGEWHPLSWFNQEGWIVV